MVKTTTFEILANFKAVMEELTDAFTSRKYKYERNYKGKRFPFFVYENDKPYQRLRTSSRYMTGKYYTDSGSIYELNGKNKIKDIIHNILKISIRGRKLEEKAYGVQVKWLETEDEYRSYLLKTLFYKIKETDPETIQYYKDYLATMKWDKPLEEVYRLQRFSYYSLGFINFITEKIDLPKKSINPYYTKYNVGRRETNVCLPEFYSRLFTGDHNFSLLKIKYAKGGKITNAGLKATSYYYYNGDIANWEFASHSKRSDLESMLVKNDIPIPKGSKYEDLAKILKEKLP